MTPVSLFFFSEFTIQIYEMRSNTFNAQFTTLGHGQFTCIPQDWHQGDDQNCFGLTDFSANLLLKAPHLWQLSLNSWENLFYSMSFRVKSLMLHDWQK